MNPLNDDELDGLLRQAKQIAPQSSPDFPARVLGAYQEQSRPASGLSWLWWRPVRIPAGVGVLAAAALLALGAVAGRTVLAPPVRAETCAHGNDSQTFTFQDFAPVQNIYPRVVRSIDDDR